MLKFCLKHFLGLGKITTKVVINLETIMMKTTYQNLWTRAKTVFRGNSISLFILIKKIEKKN